MNAIERTGSFADAQDDSAFIMRLTDERINYLSRHIVNVMVREGLIETDDESLAAQDITKIMIKFLNHEETVDNKVRAKIASIKRGIPEHSREWDVLYEQYYNEEMNKL